MWQDEANLINSFISAKRVEGLSEKSLHYYQKTIETMNKQINKPIQKISTDDLSIYQTVDEGREILDLPAIGGEEGKKGLQTLNVINAKLADKYQGGGDDGKSN